MPFKKHNQWDEEHDALKKAPDSHKVLFENEKVRVLEVVIRSGQKEPMHHHRWPSVMIVDSPTSLKYYNKENEVIDIANNKYKAKIEWMEPESLHAVENTDKRKYHAIRIELKK